jgi:hypothetical protein
MNCNVCGSATLVEGMLSKGGDPSADRFLPNDKPFYKRMLGIGGHEIHSYACIDCGNIQVIVDFTEEDKKQYLESEGQPPSVAKQVGEDDVLAEKLEVSE